MVDVLSMIDAAEFVDTVPGPSLKNLPDPFGEWQPEEAAWPRRQAESRPAVR
jgi:hypothetical protein